MRWISESAGISTTSQCGWWLHTADPFWSAPRQETELALCPGLRCVCLITGWIISRVMFRLWLIAQTVMSFIFMRVELQTRFERRWVGGKRNWEHWEEWCQGGWYAYRKCGGSDHNWCNVLCADVLSNPYFYLCFFPLQFMDHLCLWSPVLPPFTPRWVQKTSKVNYGCIIWIILLCSYM